MLCGGPHTVVQFLQKCNRIIDLTWSLKGDRTSYFYDILEISMEICRNYFVEEAKMDTLDYDYF